MFKRKVFGYRGEGVIGKPGSVTQIDVADEHTLAMANIDFPPPSGEYDYFVTNGKIEPLQRSNGSTRT